MSQLVETTAGPQPLAMQETPVVAAQVPRLAPQGNKASELFKTQLTLRSKVGQVVQKTLSAIDSVHGVDRVPGQIVIKQTAGEHTLGQYKYNAITRKPVDIGVSRKGEYPELTLAHEIGHAMDHQMIGASGRYASENDARLDEWRAAVSNSKAAKELKSYYQAGIQEIDTGDAKRTIYVDRKWVRYSLQHKELFARSYAQYIGEMSEGKEMQAGLQAILKREDYSRFQQWDLEDFAPIRAAFDELFAGLRWRK